MYYMALVRSLLPRKNTGQIISGSTALRATATHIMKSIFDVVALQLIFELQGPKKSPFDQQILTTRFLTHNEKSCHFTWWSQNEIHLNIFTYSAYWLTGMWSYSLLCGFIHLDHSSKVILLLYTLINNGDKQMMRGIIFTGKYSADFASPSPGLKSCSLNLWPPTAILGQ